MEIKCFDIEKLIKLINQINVSLFINKTLRPRKYFISNRYNYNDFINNRLPRKKMPSAKELLPIFKMIIENNMMFTGNMISCDAGEGNFYRIF